MTTSWHPLRRERIAPALDRATDAARPPGSARGPSRRALGAAVAITLMMLSAMPTQALPGPSGRDSAAPADLVEAAAVAAGPRALPMDGFLGAGFIQTAREDGAPSFLALGSPVSARLGAGGIVLAGGPPGGARGTSVLVRVSFPGGRDVTPVGEGPLGTRVSIIRGAAPESWTAGVSSYSAVVYRGLYDGVDLRFQLRDGSLKYEFEVAPGADPARIRIRYNGAASLRVEKATGDLLVSTAGGLLRDSAPSAYLAGSPSAGVRADFELSDRWTVGFRLGPHDPMRALVIDPGLRFSTLIGGAAREGFEGNDLQYQSGSGLNIDSQGNVYVTGYTYSHNFPTTDGVLSENFTGGSMDAFVLKLSPDGSTLEYSTFIGGTGNEQATALCIDACGNAYVTGWTDSLDFPCTTGAYCQTHKGEMEDIFILKLNATGESLLYSTYIGGSARDLACGMCINASGCAVITGRSVSADFPITPGVLNSSSRQSFVLKLNETGSELVFSTFMGVGGLNSGMGIAMDENDTIYACGKISRGNWDLYVLKLSADGTTREFWRVYGGYQHDQAFAIAVDRWGRSYVTGYTQCGDFPTTEGAMDRSVAAMDGFVMRLDPNGTIDYSTLVGGSYYDYLFDICVDSLGCAYVTGMTFSHSDFPTTPGSYIDQNGTFAIMARLNENGSSMLYSTFLQRSYGAAAGSKLAIDGRGHVYVLGWTRETTFPTTAGSFCETYSGGDDIFLLKLSVDLQPPIIASDQTPSTVELGAPVRFEVSTTDDWGVSNVTIEYWYGNDTAHDNLTLEMLDGDPSDCTWASNLSNPNWTSDRLRYIIRAEDYSGNLNMSATRNVSVLDRQAPCIVDLTTGPGTTGDRLDLNATVSDDLGVASVNINYWFRDRPDIVINRTMTCAHPDARGNGTYSLGISALPSDSLEPLCYTITAVDLCGNVNRTDVRSLIILDDDPPEITADLSAKNPTTGDTLELKAVVRDNLGIMEVRVTYWMTDSPETTEEMAPVAIDSGGNGTYRLNITIPLTREGNLSYVLNVTDWSGNMNTSITVTLAVIDDDPPWLEADLSDAVAYTGSPFELALNASDNVHLEQVFVEYWFGDHEDRLVLAPMTYVDGVVPWRGMYNLSIPVPLDSTEPLTYRFSVSDATGNWNNSDVVTVEVVDDVAPVANAGDDVEVGQHEPLALDGTSSTDNMGVVLWTWTVQDADVPHELDGPTANYAFPEVGTYRVTLRVADAAGNQAFASFNVTVTDTTPPVADLDTDRTVDLGSQLELDIGDSTDNVGIAAVEWDVPDGAGIEHVEGDTYRFTRLGTHNITLTLRDAAGNEATALVVVTVVDSESPVAEAGPDVTVEEGTTVVLDGSASTDNDRIVAYEWWSHPYLSATGANVTWTPGGYGTYIVTLEVRDPSGRVGQDQLTITVLSRNVTLLLGPFLDADGEPVDDATVRVTLNGTTYEWTTDGTGWAAVEVPRADVTPVVTVVVTKDGWRRMEFQTGLDGEWRATADIPPMEREVAPGWEGSALAVAVAVAAVAAVAVVAVIWWRHRAGG